MSPAARRDRQTAEAARSGPDPVTLIVGDEELLVERAVSAVLASAAAGPQAAGGSGEAVVPAGAGQVGGLDVHDVAAAGLAPGELRSVTAPSLFGGGCLVVVRGTQDAGKDLTAELVRLAAAPDPDVILVLTHSGGARNKALLTSLTDAGARRVELPGHQAVWRTARLPPGGVQPGRAEG